MMTALAIFKAVASTWMGRGLAIGVSAFAVIAINNSYQRSIGYEKRDSQVREENDKATEIGESAANKSGKPAPRGVRRLPGYR